MMELLITLKLMPIANGAVNITGIPISAEGNNLNQNKQMIECK